MPYGFTASTSGFTGVPALYWVLAAPPRSIFEMQ